jgi:predicted Zn-dependent protease
MKSDITATSTLLPTNLKKVFSKRALLFLFSGIWFSSGYSFCQDDLIADLTSEVNREFSYLSKQEIPAYYISYRVQDTKGYSANSSMGAIASTEDINVRLLSVTVRVGSPNLDNYHPIRDGYGNSGYSLIDLPLDNNSAAIKQTIWNATNDAYQKAIVDYTRVKTNVAVKVKEADSSPDFAPKKPVTYFEPGLTPAPINKYEWNERIKRLSAPFSADSAIYIGISMFNYGVSREYFVSTEGDQIVQNRISTDMAITAVAKAADGMDLPLVKTYSSDVPENLPSEQNIATDVNELIANLNKLKKAPVAEPYSGPALLSGRSAAVFFHEIFGHRIEGQRMKNEYDAQTFKQKVDQAVLPPYMNIYCDPLMKNYNGQPLNGYYKYDNQGVYASKVIAVENGILKGFLMSRTPIEGFPESNGHGRSAIGLPPVARQSNLVAETTQPRTEAEMRQELIRLIKEQNKPYGYLFEDVIGGFTTTDRYMPNAFNVFPTLVYRVYADGRPDEPVRGVDLIGTPLSMFSQIDMAGGKTEVFNGVCGAESGQVPVSAISPMLLVKIIETQKNAKSQDNYVLPRPGIHK